MLFCNIDDCRNVMRIITEEPLKEYIARFPDTRTALQNWVKIVKESQWECFADVKKSFNSVDNVGNQHYVFNIRGNHHRLVVVIKFTIKWYISDLSEPMKNTTG